MSPAGFPHSDILGSTSARDSPGLNAACHVLHRLLAPRHPPRALCSLTPSQPLTRRSGAGGIDRVLLDTTKSSISSIVTDVVTYPVVKVRSPGGDLTATTLGVGTGPSDPLVGGLRWGAHGSGDPRRFRAPDTRRRLQDKPANRRAIRGACDPKVVPGLYPGDSVIER